MAVCAARLGKFRHQVSLLMCMIPATVGPDIGFHFTRTKGKLCGSETDKEEEEEALRK